MEIRINPLSMSSIREAQAQLKQYKKDLPRKCEELARRLAMLGAETANVTFAGAVYDLDAKYHRPLEQADITVSYEQDLDNNGHFTIHADGEAVAFVEFGAGVYFNGSGSQRHRPQGIHEIGFYGQGKGKQWSWGYYGKDGKAHITAGTPEQPGMWLASQEMRYKMAEIAREVFAQ